MCMANNMLAEHMTCIQTLHIFFLCRESRNEEATAASAHQSCLVPINPTFMSSVNWLIIQSTKCQKKLNMVATASRNLCSSLHIYSLNIFSNLHPLCCSHIGVLLNLNCSFCSTSTPKPRRYFICSDSLLKKKGANTHDLRRRVTWEMK